MLRAVNDMVFTFIFGTEERKELLRGLVMAAIVDASQNCYFTGERRR